MNNPKVEIQAIYAGVADFGEILIISICSFVSIVVAHVENDLVLYHFYGLIFASLNYFGQCYGLTIKHDVAATNEVINEKMAPGFDVNTPIMEMPDDLLLDRNSDTKIKMIKASLLSPTEDLR